MGFEASAMSDKAIEYCTWFERDSRLIVVFTNELSVDDKAILDGIVEANS